MWERQCCCHLPSFCRPFSPNLIWRHISIFTACCQRSLRNAWQIFSLSSDQIVNPTFSIDFLELGLIKWNLNKCNDCNVMKYHPVPVMVPWKDIISSVQGILVIWRNSGRTFDLPRKKSFAVAPRGSGRCSSNYASGFLDFWDEEYCPTFQVSNVWLKGPHS